MKNKTIEIKFGETFSLELESIPSSGYSWQWINDEPSILIEKTDSSFHSEHPNRPGNNGVEIWKFKGIKNGKATIRMEYKRVWDTNSTIKTEIFKVNIK